MKLNKKFNDAEFKNVGFIQIYLKVESDQISYTYDAEKTKPITMADLKKLYFTGKLLVETIPGTLIIPCGFNDDGLVFSNIAYPTDGGEIID